MCKKELLSTKKNYELFNKNLSEGFLKNNSYLKLIKSNCIDDINFREILLNPKERKYIIKNDKKISIIVPTYNRKIQLIECINSILMQTYHNYEILIIDDCSTDGTKELILDRFNDSRIKYLSNKKNSGAGISRRNGYLESTGDYIIFCDDDDYYIDSEFFSDVVRYFENNEISMICSNSYIHYEKENRYVCNKINFRNLISVNEYLENFQFKYYKPNSTFCTVFKKTILQEAGLHNMKMVNDSSIYLRGLICGGKVFVNENIVGIYRVHSQNITFNIEADFLIKNLEEKKYIYNVIVQKKILDNPVKWFENQIELTVKYYISGTTPPRYQCNKVFEWIKENAAFDSKLLRDLRWYQKKVILKKFVKKIIM